MTHERKPLKPEWPKPVSPLFDVVGDRRCKVSELINFVDSEGRSCYRPPFPLEERVKD